MLRVCTPLLFRLLMSLPNWQLVSVDSSVFSMGGSSSSSSEREIRERNARESEILIGNLAMQKGIDKAELISNQEDLKELALLHENLRTLAEQIQKLLANLPQSIKVKLKDYHYRVNETEKVAPVLSLLNEHVVAIESMSSTCLLMLHLELRVHCFFHLLPLARPQRVTHANEDVDTEVHEFGRDLSNLHSLLEGLLPPAKMHYLYDGLGHLCAAIFINSSQNMQRLSEAGKKRVCRNIWGVQQRIAQLTHRREAELDRARAFYEMLTTDIDRLMAMMPEKRGAFSSLELQFLIALAIRSHPVLASQPGTLEAYLGQLRQILAKPTTPGPN